MDEFAAVKKISMAVLLLMGVTACNDTSGVMHSVEWYKGQNDKRSALLAVCRDNPVELSAMPDCVNAEQAEHYVKADMLERQRLALYPKPDLQIK